MTIVIPVSVEWLTLREAVDGRARSTALAARAASMVRGPLTVHDLGSGTGSMMRWLAPLLPGPQTWVLHDWNEGLLLHAAKEAVVDGGGVPAEVRTSATELGLLREDALVGASLVTTSALLDVLARDELEAVVRACVAAGVPALMALSVTGRVDLDPAGAGDRVFEQAFNDHQRRDNGRRRHLGPDAVGVVAELFREAGWHVEIADTPWLLGPDDRALTEQWLAEWLAAAVDERPALEEWADEYGRKRVEQLALGTLRVTVHHQDLLAWPA